MPEARPKFSQVLRSVRKRGARYVLLSQLAPRALRRIRAVVYSMRGVRFVGGTVGQGFDLRVDRGSKVEFGKNNVLEEDVRVLAVRASLGLTPAVVRVGDDTLLKESCRLLCKSGTIEIGHRVAIGARTEIVCESACVSIGNDSRIAADAFIITNNHVFDELETPIREQGRRHHPVVIGSDVWLGRRAMIMPGVRVGNGAIVAAGAVVTSDVAAGTVVGGVPAVLIRTRGRRDEPDA